jgi:hypothetical protein
MVLLLQLMTSIIPLWDWRFLYYCKPLLDYRTVGTQGSVQVAILILTESYGSYPLNQQFVKKMWKKVK